MSRPPAFLAHLGSLVALLLAGLALAPAARAQAWAEVGDAGDLPAGAQLTIGAGPLTTITGVLGSAVDVDLYCIQLGFTPRALGIPAVSLQCVMDAGPNLWVFDANGIGVTTNLVCLGGNKTVTTVFFPAVGTYYVGVAYSGLEPQSAGGAIWLTGVPAEHSPDGAGAAGPIVAWTGTPLVAAPNPYQLSLSYTSYCDAATPAALPTWGALKLRY